MANPLMKKAVDYMLNQWTALKNYIRNGLAEISNNPLWTADKLIKLILKNCQNIGSEEAAERDAFTHSILECCILNKVNPYDYLLDIFTRIKYGTAGDKKLILPCFWQK